MRALIALLPLSLAACSTLTPQESQLIQAQLSWPTFKVECPSQGCNFERFEYYDPNQQVRMPTSGYDLANKLIDTAGGIAAGLGSPAALHCQSQGYALPDTAILAKMHQNAVALDAADTSGGEITIASLIGGADINLGRARSVHTAYAAGSGNTGQHYLSFTTGSPRSTGQRQWQLAVIPVRMIDK